jgi:hypothetical protein
LLTESKETLAAAGSVANGIDIQSNSLNGLGTRARVYVKTFVPLDVAVRSQDTIAGMPFTSVLPMVKVPPETLFT